MSGGPLPRFRCVTLRRSGASEIRIVRATDEAAARAQLEAAGLVPVQIEAIGPSLVDALREKLPAAGASPAPRLALPRWRFTRPVWLALPPRATLVSAGLILATIPASTALGAWGLTALSRWQLHRLEASEAPALARYAKVAAVEQVRPRAEAAMQAPAISQLVARLAAALPADAGLAGLSLDERGGLVVEVETPDPDRLRPALAADPLLGRLEEVGQTMTDEGTMRVTLKGRLR